VLPGLSGPVFVGGLVQQPLFGYSGEVSVAEVAVGCAEGVDEAVSPGVGVHLEFVVDAIVAKNHMKLIQLDWP